MSNRPMSKFSFSLPVTPHQALVGLAAALFAPTVLAVSIPQAPVVTYGLIRDEYGSPLKSSSAARAILVEDAEPDGVVYATTAVGETAYPGMNYRLSLEIDSEGPSRPYAVVSGTLMRLKCVIDGEAQHLSPTPAFAAPVNGTAQRLDFSIGADADNDGLPDAWEAWVLQLAGRPSDAAAIAAFAPGADADGDGMSNRREFFAGTDPFQSTDLLTITSFKRVGGGARIEIKFTSVPDRTYRIVTSASLTSPVWVPCATTRQIEGTPAYETYSGTGRDITVYVDVPEGTQAFFRVAAD